MTTKPLIIFETDDMLFAYNPEGRSFSGKTGKISNWFSKQDSERMLQEAYPYTVHSICQH